MEDGTAGYLADRTEMIREHVMALAAAFPGLAAELMRVGAQFMHAWENQGAKQAFALMFGFLVLGFVLEAVYRFSIRRIVYRAAPSDSATVRERLHALAMRLAQRLGGLAAFALGSAAAFVAFEWPPLMRRAVLVVLVAFIGFRLALVAGRTLLSPKDARLRILAASDEQAAFWSRRIIAFTGWLAIGWVAAVWLSVLGMELAARQIVVYGLGLGLLAIAMESLWARSRLAALGCLLAWGLWVSGARGGFWLVIVAIVLPDALRLLQGGADHVLRPPAVDGVATHGVLAAAVGRLLRALAIIGAAFLLVHAFGLDVEALAASDTMWTRLLRGATHALAIILLADVAWRVFAAVIDQKLSAAQPPATGVAPADLDEENRRGRLRTLLPIVRGVVLAVLIVMTVLMSLSAVGVEVAPLLAGAGVVGVALGFGSQTLVRDLLSKFFYLLDDAFRVGEYIQSGTYKGTVEHLGVRSVRLRHHRGPLYTIPYGQLGAVQNMARDWVIDKMTIGLTYDSDLDLAKKLIKQIGKELQKNPEFAASILEPLKMQGVEQFGDFAIQIRMKMMTRPGQQFTIRRRAYAMIKQQFAANGIKFALPTVTVAGAGDAAAAAVARQALDLASPTRTTP